MKKIIKKIIKEEIEDFEWANEMNPEPWEEFMFPYTDLKGELEQLVSGKRIVYRDKNGEWIFHHEQNLKDDNMVTFNYGKIWKVLKSSFEYNEIQDVLKSWLDDNYGLKGVRPTWGMFH